MNVPASKPRIYIKTKQFEVKGQVYSIWDMIESNADDEEFLAWLYTAKVGDTMSDWEPCKRIS